VDRVGTGMQSKASDADNSPIGKKRRRLIDSQAVAVMDGRSSEPHGAGAKRRRKKHATEQGGKKKTKTPKAKKKGKREALDIDAQLFVIDRTGTNRS
jgi:hypothetical protein